MDLITFIQQRLEESGISPSFEEMKEALDLKSKSGVHRLISALEERGFIRRLPNRARALEVLGRDAEKLARPIGYLLGQPAGHAPRFRRQLLAQHLGGQRVRQQDAIAGDEPARLGQAAIAMSAANVCC